MMFLCRIYEYNILGQINVGQMTDKKVFEKLLKKTLDNFKDMNKTDTAELSGTDLFLVGKGSMGKYGNADGKKECVKKITKEFFKQHGIPVT